MEIDVRDGTVDPPVAFGGAGVEVVGGQDDLQGPRAADEAGERLQCAPAGDQCGADLGLAEDRSLAAGEAQVAGEYELAAYAAGAAADRGDADEVRAGQADK
jgi:hypothetical protein